MRTLKWLLAASKLHKNKAPPQYISEYQYVHSAVQHGALLLSSLLAANSQFSVLICQKMQLTGWDNGN